MSERGGALSLTVFLLTELWKAAASQSTHWDQSPPVCSTHSGSFMCLPLQSAAVLHGGSAREEDMPLVHTSWERRSGSLASSAAVQTV